MELPAGELTFVFNDIVDSSGHWDRHRETMGASHKRLYALLRRILGQEGHEFADAGDGLYFAFTHAESAVKASASAVQAIRQENWGEHKISVRFALHTGTAIATEEGNYYGPTLNRLARLLSAGHGEQILLSDTTGLLLQDALSLSQDESLRVKQLGERHLRNWPRPLTIYQVCGTDLPSEFPPLKLPNQPRHNLSQPLDNFIGRSSEIQEIETLLLQNHLVTLKSTGGCGKSRLALEAGLSFLDMYQNGVYFVGLQSLTQPKLFWELLASTLSLSFGVDRTAKEAVLTFLGNDTASHPYSKDARAGTLLILDNCEDLLETEQIREFQHAVHELLTSPRCRNVRILATSREPLGLRGERVRDVMPLSLPAGDDAALETIAGTSAVALFDDRARAADGSFMLSDHLPGVVCLVRLLDGIPLALELAARWVGTMSPQEIADEIQLDPSLLENTDSTAPERHQTMTAAIAWSYRQLARKTPNATILFKRMASFVGGCTLESLREAVAYPPLTAARIPALLRELVDKSLVIRVETPHGTDDSKATRYRLLEPIRQFARNEATSEEKASADSCYAEWCLSLAETLYPESRQSTNSAINRLEAEHDNLRAALRYWEKDDPKRYQLAGAIHRFWFLRGYHNEGRVWLKGITEAEGLGHEIHARALNAAGIMAWTQGDYSDAERCYLRCLELHQMHDDRNGIVMAYNNLGLVASTRKEYETALRFYQQSHEIDLTTEESKNRAIVLNNLGDTYRHLGDYSQAQFYLEQSLHLHERLNERYGMAGVAHSLGELLREAQQNAPTQDYTQTIRWYCKSLEIEYELQHFTGIVPTLEVLGECAIAQQRFTEALRFYATAEATRREHHIIRIEEMQERWESHFQRLKQEYGEQFEALWQKASGELKTVVEAVVAYANQPKGTME